MELNGEIFGRIKRESKKMITLKVIRKTTTIEKEFLKIRNKL